MITLHKFILWLLLSTVKVGEANEDVTQHQGTRATSKTSTDVVNLSFCSSDLPTKVNEDKKTLEEVHTYAELKHDPRASLPDSFTVCSTIIVTECDILLQWAPFFSILNNNGGQFLAPFIRHGNMESQEWSYP